MIRRVTRSLLLAAGLSATAIPAHAQGWAADIYAGGTQQTALADRVSDINLIGNIRFAGRDETFLYLSGATPLNEHAVNWAAAGLGRRFGTRAAVHAGLDVSGHGYVYGARSVPGGGGATVHALPFVGWRAGVSRVELRAGRHEHRFRYDGVDYGRGLNEIGVSAGTASGAVAAEFTGRWLADDSTSFPFAGVQLSSGWGSARVWGGVGRWMMSEDGSTEWSAGAAWDAGRIGHVWASVRGDARDPLFETGERSSWNIGISRTFGRRPGTTTVPAPRVSEGGVVFRLPRRLAEGVSGDVLAVAGEFSDWQPRPMRLSGDEWVLEVVLPPGVHRFSFVTGAGEWFVPEGYPGRLNDGMGGWVAVLVVQ